jgi:hypothetical protein
MFVLLLLFGALGAAPTAARQATPVAEPDPELVALLDYDASAPLDIQEIGVEERDGAVVRDITYASPGRTVEAYLVEPAAGQATPRGYPAAAPPYAGIVFFHWLEPEAENSNRTEFLPDAIDLAGEGVVSVLIQGVFPWTEDPSGIEADRAAIVEEALAARRAVDLLVARDDVDPDRLAVVGHDYGAMYGSLLATADRRPKAYVLMAATPRHADWNIPFWLGPGGMSPADQQEYRRALAPLDPINAVASPRGYPAPAAILFQVAREDFFISAPTGFEFFYAASDPKEIMPYDVGHPLNEQATADRLAWLRSQLGLA